MDASLFAEIIRDAKVPVLVDFWAPWCGPCKSAAPEVAYAAQNLAGKALVLKVNTEAHPDLAAQFAIRSIPNFAVFRDGELKWQQAGLIGHRQLEQTTLGRA
ncbi:MAG: thioredoxin domain-containing protein [Pseudomonadota bacterium]|nr:thioredoxin domain-containing protein [Pseudomonadota bacterium]